MQQVYIVAEVSGLRSNQLYKLYYESFNSQVGKRGFNSAHAAYDQALIDELVRRGIDVSTAFNGTTICHLSYYTASF